MVWLKFVLSTSFLLLFILAPLAEAEDRFSEADELLLFQDMTLVVSASRLTQPQNLLSVPVTVLTADDLHYGGHTSISEALRYAPGLDIVRLDRNRYATGIRGLQGMFSDRIMTLVDGMPADSPAFGGPEFTSLPVLMEDIERIEIVRGPGGAAWGANALTGVINIISKDPGKDPGLFVSFTGSEFRDSSSQIRFSDNTGNLHWLVSAGYNEIKSSDEALGSSKNEGSNDFERRLLARSAFVYTLGPDLEISFGTGLTATESGAFETAGIVKSEDNDLDTANGYLRAKKIFSSDTEGYFRWAGRYQDMDRPSFGNARYRVKEQDIEAQVDMNGFADHTLALGANFRCTHISARGVEPGVFTLADENIREYWAGLFVSDYYHYSRKLGFESQLRADYFSEGDIDWSGRISSTYGIDAAMDHVLRFSAAKSYRQSIGFINDAVFSSEPDAYPFAQYYSVDPDLDPEQVWSLEAGYLWGIREQLTLKTDLYYMWYRDLIGMHNEFVFSEAGQTELFMEVKNTGDAEGYGCEIELDYEAGPLLWTAWYAFNDFETEFFRQSVRSLLPAKNKVGLRLRWNVAENWMVQGQYAYSGAVREDVSEYSMDSSNHLDITVSRKFMARKGEVMLGVTDLFTEEYEPMVGLEQTAGNKIPGRTFFARLQYTF